MNYDKDLIDRDNAGKANHVFRGHLSIDTACDFVKANYSDSLENVVNFTGIGFCTSFQFVNLFLIALVKAGSELFLKIIRQGLLAIRAFVTRSMLEGIMTSLDPIQGSEFFDESCKRRASAVYDWLGEYRVLDIYAFRNFSE